MGKKSFKKTALMISLCLLLVWAILGTSATIAWFTDTPETDRNSFLIGQLDLDVSYKNDIVTQYTPVDGQTPIFNDQALYEPGYTQVVYLQITNNGNVDFNYKISVDKVSYVDSINRFGTTLHLPDHLRFGVAYGATEADLDRAMARGYATEEMGSYHLNTYSKIDEVTVAAGETRYAALVVFMPEEVGNEANYQGQQPMVDLGITVYAQQAGTPIQ